VEVKRKHLLRQKKNRDKRNCTYKPKKLVTDSSTTYFNIETLNLVSLDSTLPIKIIDSKGNTTTFL